MAEQKTGRRGCFKFGCLGCVGLVALLLIASGAVAVMAMMLGPPERHIVEADVTRRVPAAEIAVGSALPGRVVLDLSGAAFDIRPGKEGEPIRIEGSYNDGGFELIEEMQRDEGGGWTWTVRFRRNVSWVRMLHGDQHEENRLQINLPPNIPFRLEGEVSTGMSQIELGGLAVLAVDLDLGMGQHQLSFSEPLLVPMESFELDAGMGEFVIDGLGHASPAAVRIDGRMGELRVDLHGEWRNDATLRARWRMGACELRVPDNVQIDADDVNVFMGGVVMPGLRGRPQLPADAPTLKLDLVTTMGEVRVVR